MFLSLAAAALVVFVIAGPGSAASDQALEPDCASVCINADGAFGPTIPVSLDKESAANFAAIIGGDAGAARPITMDFMSVDEGAEVVILEAGARIATVQLDSGRIGFVPVAWLESA
jgi:hypothetical protein